MTNYDDLQSMLDALNDDRSSSQNVNTRASTVVDLDDLESFMAELGTDGTSSYQPQGDDLDMLMNDLSSKSNRNTRTPVKSTASNYRQDSRAAVRPDSEVVNVNDLEALMNDLASPVSNRPSQAPSNRNTYRGTAEDLESLMEDLSGGNNNFGGTTFGDTTFGENTYGDTTYGTNTYGDTTYGDNTYGSNTYGDTTYGDNTYGGRPQSQAVNDVDALYQALGGAGGDDDLNSLLSRMSGTPQNGQRAVHVGNGGGSDELEALMNDLGSSKRNTAPSSTDLNYMMSNRASMQASFPTNANPRASQLGGVPSDDLDQLMRDMSRPSARNTVTTSPPPTKNKNDNQPDDLSALMSELSGVPSNQRHTAQSVSDPNQELDDLMQNLHSPQQAKPQQQKPTSNQSKDLEDIMAGLNSSNPPRNVTPNKTAVVVPTLPHGVCAGCRKHISGEIVSALGKTFHPEHFICSTCNRAIGTGNFFENDGQPQCENCYQSHFCQRCAHCSQPITVQVVNALGKVWHPNCFVCTNCLNPFFDGNFFEKDQRPYCQRCYVDVFSNRCRACNQQILGGMVNALGASWHVEHFNCQTCHRPFSNGQFYELKGLPYCEQDYRALQASANYPSKS